jgi:NAD(P)-dependent dehydrogenase (short-subunit alcohol dehydrogenase family)
VIDKAAGGRRFLVLGGGIGPRLAQQVVSRGECALLISRVRPTRCTVDHLTADLRGPDAWAGAVHSGRARLGGLDVLMNCVSGGLGRVPFSRSSDADWIEAFEEEVLWPLEACRHGLAVLNPGGVIANVTSLRAAPDDTTLAPAAAAFAAMEAMTTTFAAQARARGVRVFGVAPVVQRTGATSRLPPGRLPLAELDASPAAVGELVEMIDKAVGSGVTFRMNGAEVLTADLGAPTDHIASTRR